VTSATLTEEVDEVMEPLRLAATGTSIVGFAMMAIAIVALVISIRDAATRLLDDDKDPEVDDTQRAEPMSSSIRGTLFRKVGTPDE
jgi:hypothetical protein